MTGLKKIRTALISVYDKTGILAVAQTLVNNNIKILSTGGTQTYLMNNSIAVTPIEEITDYPSIFGGRVKTLHPKIFGGILNRQEESSDVRELQQYNVPQIDLVIVDLYPFQETIEKEGSNQDIIEKIDIGGVSLIRASAKNYEDVLSITDIKDYPKLLDIIDSQNASSNIEQRLHFAVKSFEWTQKYDSDIFKYLKKKTSSKGKEEHTTLRYGENPHQKAYFEGNLSETITQISGKALSYNNLLDIDAALSLIGEFGTKSPTFAIIKHNNACGCSQQKTLLEAFKSALEGDPKSAFGGIFVSNKPMDIQTANEIHKIFFEVILAPSFEDDALGILTAKKSRIIIQYKSLPQKTDPQQILVRSCLNGKLIQQVNFLTDKESDFHFITELKPNSEERKDLLFASKICKHSKSNAIVIVKNRQLLASGVGQTSRVDALQHAIEKAKDNNFNLNGAVMASDAFFPFPDCIEIASKVGIKSVIQPGGSKNDNMSIDAANRLNISMVFTKVRHFKH